MPPGKSPRRKRRPRKVPAAALTALRRIELVDVPMPEPKAGEVLVELSRVGLCGSDLHYWRLGRIGPQVIAFPQILGHEPAGRVVALGKGVNGFVEGDAVAVEPGISCMHCRYCLEGKLNLCEKVLFLGSPGFTGAFQPYLAMPAHVVEKLPPGIDADLGASGEPLGIALHALDLVRLAPGENLAVVGGGPVGLSLAAMARALGAQVVALSDPREARRSAARRLGVRRVTVADRAAFVAAVLAETGGYGADIVAECAGAPEGLDTAVEACCRGARIAYVGIPEVDTHSVDPHTWRRREVEVVQVRRSNHTLPRTLEILGQTQMNLRQAGYFSGTVGLGGIQAAFERLEDRGDPAVKLMVDPRSV